MKAQSYKDLEIYILGEYLAVEIHKMTLTELPKFEMYEGGSQIRRSSKSIVSNIVEGYGRRRYKNEFIHFLTYAVASCDETKAHLEMFVKTGSLKKEIFDEFSAKYDQLCAKLFSSHPETTFPDENIQLPALSMSRNPLKKGFWRELNADIQVFPSGNSNFRMETI